MAYPLSSDRQDGFIYLNVCSMVIDSKDIRSDHGRGVEPRHPRRPV